MTTARRLLLGTAAAWIVAGLVSVVPLPRPVGGVPDLERRAEEIGAALTDLTARASEIAATALDSFPPERSRRPRHAPLLDRLEGIGIVDPDGKYLVWQGSPADPPPGFLADDEDGFWIRTQGARRSLVARAGPDDEAWRSLASFTLSLDDGASGIEELLPEELLRGVDVRIAVTREGAASPELLRRTWETPDGMSLARFELQAAADADGARRLAGTLVALAALLTVAWLAVAVDWRRRVVSGGGLALAAAALVAARALVGWTDGLHWLLPREASSPALFGLRSPWHALGSPADFLLTALAAYLFALALVRWSRAAPRRRRWLPPVAVGGTLLSGRLVMLVADHSAGDLSASAGWPRDARLLVSVGLTIFLLAVATVAAGWTLAPRPRGESGSSTPRPFATLLCFCALALAAAFVLQVRESRARLERLRVDLAPQVLEQGERRELALKATVRQVLLAYAQPTPEEIALPPDQLAFHYWIDSPLAHAGYQSSLAFYDFNLALVSHFGYDLPALDETLGAADAADAELPEVLPEPFQPVPSVRQRLLHLEAALTRHGEPRGTVVAHVLDEPENLPFLPAARAYLAALGLRPGPDDEDVVHYVVYDAQGTPLRSTLTQPPSESGAFRLAALAGDTVQVRAGDERLAGIALGERDRLHLLLVPSPGALERVADALRFLLAALAVVLLALGLPEVLRSGGPSRLAETLRGSFQRKLVAALLIGSVVPLIGLSLLLRGYIESRADEELAASAVEYVGAAQKLLEDATTPLSDDDEEWTGDVEIGDPFLLWLRRVVGQDVHVYERGRLLASSKRELFDAGMLPERLDGWIQRQVAIEGRASLVRPVTLGGHTLPVAYAPIRTVDAARQLLVAVPMVRGPGTIRDEVHRVTDIILVSTVSLVAILIFAATALARTVARPVRALAGATEQIASGNYDARLRTDARDEVGALVRGFNAMAGSLERQRATLERRREYIETLLRHATTGVLSVDRDGLVVTLNPTAVELLARAGAAVEIGSDLPVAIAGAERLAPLAASLRDGGRSGGEPLEIDLDDDGAVRRIQGTLVPLPGDGGGPVGTLILLDDVTELMRSNQLAAWAEMARAIAHEIKNPLTPIQLSSEHLRRLLTDRGLLPDATMDACLETIIKQVRTLYEIAGEFSAYAKLPVLDPSPCDPVEFLRETVAPYRVSPRDGIEVVERYEDVPAVAIDRRVLARALVNLIENALQAMPEGGRLQVGCSPAADGRVALFVLDDGAGIDAEAQRRLFEPYFSTKSSGTGLGLAIALRAVEAHHGAIEVDSREGEGSSFRILLPALPTA